MTVEITRPDKNTLILDTPVMPAAGTFGFGDVYRGIVQIEKLGAIITNPVTYQPWHPASGTRVIPLDAGVLVHTGLPNAGISKTLAQYRTAWEKLPVPIIMHIVATTPQEVARCASRIEAEQVVAAIELGLNDDTAPANAEDLVRAALKQTEKPLLVRLPMQDAYELAGPVADEGAGALVVTAPPRGTARDPYSGRLVPGRIYGPLVKPMALRSRRPTCQPHRHSYYWCRWHSFSPKMHVILLKPGHEPCRSIPRPGSNQKCWRSSPVILGD